MVALSIASFFVVWLIENRLPSNPLFHSFQELFESDRILPFLSIILGVCIIEFLYIKAIFLIYEKKYLGKLNAFSEENISKFMHLKSRPHISFLNNKLK